MAVDQRFSGGGVTGFTGDLSRVTFIQSFHRNTFQGPKVHLPVPNTGNASTLMKWLREGMNRFGSPLAAALAMSCGILFHRVCGAPRVARPCGRPARR